MVAKVKNVFGYDDSLDAFGVHGAGGMIGAILTGIFATSSINPIYHDAQGKVLRSGVVDGNWGQLLNRCVAIAVAWVIAICGTLIILKVVDVLVGLRVSAADEVQGLDVSQHGEEGYYWELSAS